MYTKRPGINPLVKRCGINPALQYLVLPTVMSKLIVDPKRIWVSIIFFLSNNPTRLNLMEANKPLGLVRFYRFEF
jgi:hypothetical protein